MTHRQRHVGLPADTAPAPDRALPPDAPARPRTAVLPDHVDSDPFVWLENPEDPEVIAYLEAENAYTEAVLAPATALRETLYRELIGRVKRTDTNVPTPWNGYLYYQRTEEGRNYDIICRKQGNMDAPEQILLDLNIIAGEYLDLVTWRPSPDNRYLAYNLDLTGEERYTVSIMDMESGEVIEELPPSFEVEWARDSRTLYYSRQDEKHRSYQLNRHAVGTDTASDEVLYQEDDENFWLRIYPARDRAYLFLESSVFDTHEISAISLDQPAADVSLIVPRTEGVQNYGEHHGDEFLILTNEDAPNFRLMAAPVSDPARVNWREVIPHREDILLTGIEPFRRHLVIFGREDGFSQVWIRTLSSGQTTPVPFAEASYVVEQPDRATGGENWEFDTARVRLAYSSLVTPSTIYEIDMDSGERTLLKQTEIVGGHDPGRYTTERLVATAPDGRQVPISLVSLIDAPAGLAPGPRPLLLWGYGGYGISQEPFFSSQLLALLERGVSCAVAHIRGGMELGAYWWEEGRLLNKKNCFSDFIACAEHLVDEGHTAPDRLVVYGASNGGLLMGVVANKRPELFRVVVAHVPLADVIGFLLRSSIGPVNQDELGDPSDSVFHDYQRSYSPYQNVRPQDYPAMFVSGGLHDNRTPYWLPAKWVARLRDLRTDDKRLVLHTEMTSGHTGVSGFSQRCRQTALWFAFVLQELGLSHVKPDGDGKTARRQDGKTVGQ